MTTNFDGIITSGGLTPSSKNTPCDLRTRIESIDEIDSIPVPFVGMVFYVINEDAFYVVKSLKSKKIGTIDIPNSAIDEYELFIKESGTITIKKNNPIAVAEMINVAKSYYNVRYKEDGETPRFIYDANRTPTSDNFDVTDPVYGGAIDCSTYVSLVLRGIQVWNSPYKSLIDNITDDDSSLNGSDDDNTKTEENPNEDDTNVWDPSSIDKNNIDFTWAINPAEWKNQISIDSDEVFPVRRASQMAQWMYERGQCLPLDETFSNLEPGDLIFWAKEDSNGDYIRPSRWNHISHVAICIGKTDAPTDDPKFPSKYPYKHTMLEVTTKAPYVLNRTLEKCSPSSVVMICRPDLGSISHENRAVSVSSGLGITNLDELYVPGTYYLTSSIVKGLPDGVETGSYCMLKVERTIARLGRIYSIKQTLTNTKTNECFYIRTQYCYSYLPDTTSWTNWQKYSSTSALEERIAALESALTRLLNNNQ